MQEVLELKHTAKTENKPLVYALVGNPNSGKTTLFNHLTGLRQKTGNYPGVTVEKKEGICFSQHGEKIKVIDLPGSYSLNAHSPDEEVLQDVLMGRVQGLEVPERIICVVDASNLERSLFLAVQIAELGRPMILALNMTDIAQKRGITIDIDRMEKTLGVTVIPTQAHKKIGLLQLKLAMSKKNLPQPNSLLNLPQAISEAVVNIQSTLLDKNIGNLFKARGEALLLLSDYKDTSTDSPVTSAAIQKSRQKLQSDLPNWKSIIIQSRYARVNEILTQCIDKKKLDQKSLSEHLDSILLHKIFGPIALISILGILFFTIFSLAEYPMAGIEWCFAKLGIFIENTLLPGPINDLLVHGIISGVGSVMMFLPQIMLLFLFIGLLEESGYLPRAAFILDKIMNKVGLQGRAFIPLLSSYACAVPGIMATRTIRSKAERLTTIMIAPWMSCSARLPIYLLMITALVPSELASTSIKTIILLGTYAIATLTAFLFAFIFRKTLLKGKTQSSILELPNYQLPSWKNALIQMLDQAFIFMKRAGLLIVSFSILIWFLSSYPKNQSDQTSIQHSYIGKIGKAIEPIIQPLGYDWRVGVGILGSFAARELFVSTMAVIFNTEKSLEEDVQTLALTLKNQVRKDGSPLFDTLTCSSLMVFFMFAMQCMSTLIVVRKETNSLRWPLFQLFYMTSFAYLAAFIVYQGGKILGF